MELVWTRDLLLGESDRKIAEKKMTVECQSVVKDRRSNRMRIDLNVTRTDEIKTKA